MLARILEGRWRDRCRRAEAVAELLDMELGGIEEGMGRGEAGESGSEM